MQPTSIILGGADSVREMFDAERHQRIADISHLLPATYTEKNWQTGIADIAQAEIVFSTWGMPAWTPAELEQFPKLRAVFYAAGSVRAFAEPLLARDIAIFSAAAANAVPVAELTLAQILLANKGYFRNIRENFGLLPRDPDCRSPGNFGGTIALLGAGEIGRALIQRLRPFNLKVIVFDPFLSEENAAALGVEKVDLAEAFARGLIVSNHLANIPETRAMLTGELFRSLQKNATFINTGRGATVNELEMISVLQERADLTALLDVTDPEPPVAGSPLYTMLNVHLSSHIAGSIGEERLRMVDWMIKEFIAYQAGQPTRLRVHQDQLARMA